MHGKAAGKYAFTYVTVDGDSLVFAATGRFSTEAQNPFLFESVRTKRGTQWNDTTSVFTIYESLGLYFIGLSVSPHTNRQVDYTMVLSGQRYAGITGTSTFNNNVDVIGRDVITPLYAADTVHVSNGYRVYSLPNHFDTSITIFSISNSMDDMVAFSVAREDTLSGSSNPVTFAVSLYNAGYHYDELSHVFTAPSSGVYFFSFSLGLVTGGRANFILYKNDEPFVNILRASTAQTGTDTIGRSVMMELDLFDTVHIANPVGYTARSSELKETSFSGFKYEPKHGNQVSIMHRMIKTQSYYSVASICNSMIVI